MHLGTPREVVARYPHGPVSKLTLGTAPHLAQREVLTVFSTHWVLAVLQEIMTETLF